MSEFVFFKINIYASSQMDLTVTSTSRINK